jgi:hypothetical protein
LRLNGDEKEPFVIVEALQVSLAAQDPIDVVSRRFDHGE